MSAWDLFLACKDGDTAGVEKLLAMGINVNVADWDERRVIHMAANYGHEEMLVMLLARGADKNIADKWGITALHEACMNDFPNIALALIEAGADLGAKNNEGKTPMELASAALRRTLIERSLRHVSWELFHAAKNGNLETVRHLVESGRVDINVQDWDSRAPIHLAAEYGHAEMLEWMLHNGGDKNIQDRWGVTPSHEAAKHDHAEIAVSLLEAGADMNIADENGKRPLDLATPELRKLLDEKLDLWNSAMRGDLETVRNILAGGSCTVASVDADGSTALFSACAGGHMHVLKYLLIVGADRNHQNKRGETPLMYALVHKKDTVTRYLLDNGASLDLKTTRGHTALYFALKSRRRRMVRVLTQKGAKFDFGEPYWSLVKDAVKRSEAEFFACLEENGITLNPEILVEVMLAAGRYGSEPILSMCLKKGANVNAEGAGGRRLIHQLAQHGHFRLMKVLLRDYRPEVNARDNDMATPLLLAARGAHVNTSHLLLKAGAAARFDGPQFTKLLSDAVQQNHLLCACSLVERGVAMSTDVLDIAERHVREKGLPAEGEGEEGEARAVLQFYASVLWHAALEGRAGCLRILTASGVDCNFRSPVSAGVGLGAGNTPLMIASARGHADIVEALLAVPTLHNVNLANDAGNTALKLACEGGHARVAALLVEKGGATVDAKDAAGRTPLAVSVAKQHRDLVRFLVSKGANALSRDERGRTPYDTALVFHAAQRLRGGGASSANGEQKGKELPPAGLPPQLDIAGTRPDAKDFVDALVGTEAVSLLRRKYAVRQVWRESIMYAVTVILLTVLAFQAYGGSQNRVEQYAVGYGLRRTVVQSSIASDGTAATLSEQLLQPSVADAIFAPQRSFPAFWAYLAQTLLPALVAPHDTGGTGAPGGYFLAGRDRLLGPVRVRQVRSRPDACAVPPGFDAAIARCYAAGGGAEERSPFGGPDPLASPSAASAFAWRDAGSLSASELTGTAGTYPGGGYAIDVSPATWSADVAALAELRERRWLDPATRAVVIQFNSFNPSEGVAAAVHVLYEFPPSGGIVPHYFLAVGRLPYFVYNTAAGYAVLLLEIAVVLLHLYYILTELRALARHPRAHAASSGFLYNAVLYTLFVAMVALRVDAAVSLVKSPRPTLGGPYVDLYPPLQRQQAARELLAIVLILSWMRVLKIMRILPVSGPILQSVFNTFVNPSVLTILLMFLLVLVTFSLGLHVTLHDAHPSWRSYRTSISRAFTITFGDVGGGQGEVSPYFIATILYAFFLLGMCFVVVNLFISVFIEEYRAARESQQARYNDHITALMEGEPGIEEAARREAAFQRLVELRYAEHIQRQTSVRAGTTFRGGKTTRRGLTARSGAPEGEEPPSSDRDPTRPLVVQTRNGPLEIPRLPVHLIAARLAKLAAEARDGPLTPPAAHGRDKAGEAEKRGSIVAGSEAGSVAVRLASRSRLVAVLLGGLQRLAATGPVAALRRLFARRPAAAAKYAAGDSVHPLNDGGAVLLSGRSEGAASSSDPTPTLRDRPEASSKAARFLRRFFHRLPESSSDRTERPGPVARLLLPSRAPPPREAAGLSLQRAPSNAAPYEPGALAAVPVLPLDTAPGGPSPPSDRPAPPEAAPGAFTAEVPDELFFKDGGPAWSYLQRARLVKPGALPPGDSGAGGAERERRGGGEEEGYGAEGGLRDPEAEAHRQRLQTVERDLVGLKMTLEKGLLTQSEQVQKMKRNLEALTFLSEDSLLNADDRLGQMTAVRTRELSRLQTTLGDVSTTVMKRTRVAAAAAAAKTARPGH